MGLSFFHFSRTKNRYPHSTYNGIIVIAHHFYVDQVLTTKCYTNILLLFSQSLLYVILTIEYLSLITNYILILYRCLSLGERDISVPMLLIKEY